MDRYSLFYSWTPTTCSYCHKTWGGNGGREVPYHRDNSDRGVCSGSRRAVGGPRYESPRPLIGLPSPAMARRATRSMRRAKRIMRRRAYPPFWLAHDVLLRTVEDDRVHEVLGYPTFAEYVDTEVTNRRRRWPWRR